MPLAEGKGYNPLPPPLILGILALLRSVIFFNTACRDRPGGTVSSCPLPAVPGAPARGGASPQLLEVTRDTIVVVRGARLGIAQRVRGESDLCHGSRSSSRRSQVFGESKMKMPAWHHAVGWHCAAEYAYGRYAKKSRSPRAPTKLRSGCRGDGLAWCAPSWS